MAGCAAPAPEAAPPPPQAQPEATAPSTTLAPTTLAPTTLAPTTTIARVAVPKLVGMPLAAARSALSGRGLRWIVKYAVTRRAPAGTVVVQHRRAGLGVVPGTAVGLVVAKAPPPAPPTSPPVTAPPPSDCSPSYPGVCLHTGRGDYDCEGGSGDGPNYVAGPVRVRPPDPFDLDRDGDGWGCES